MQKITFKLTHGVKAKLRREGVVIVDNPEVDYYEFRKMPKRVNMEINQHFGEKSKLLSQGYKALSDGEKEALRKEMKREKFGGNLWNYYWKKSSVG